MNRALPLVCLIALVGCDKSKDAVKPVFSGPPQAFKLLTETPEAETSTRLEKREDLFVRTESGEPIPRVVAVGEVGPVSRHAGRVRLYGDEAGREGWSIDNFVLLEITEKKGAVRRVAIGFQQGVTLGAEQIDTTGQLGFSFGPGEIDISSYLPLHDEFTIRATALDVGGVGRVSNLYMILSAESGAPPQDEDYREF